MFQIIILLFTVIIGAQSQNVHIQAKTTNVTVKTTTVNPEFEGTTDIPEEIERGEDVVTKNGSLPTTPFLHDPMEQSDTYNPTRKPMQIQNLRTKRQSSIMTTRTTPTKTKTPETPTKKPQTTTEAEEAEVEETTAGEQEYEGGNSTTSQNNNTTPQNNSTTSQNNESCPPLHDAVVEHHVILRHGDCEIVISQDDSIRWFNEPGKSAPSVFVRHISP